MITPPPTLVDRAPTPVDRRDFNVGSYLDGVFSDLGNIPSYVASGVPNFFQDLPTGGAVLSKLNISNGDLDAQPTKVLNIP